MRNPSNILRHELIGLGCEVVGSKNKSLIGLKGRIVDESMKTLVLGEERKRVAKQDNKFKVTIGQKKLIIDGSLLVSRPEDRIKKKFKKW